jgi:hypothetical protein
MLSLRPFLPALLFGLVTVGLLVAGLGFQPLRLGSRERRVVNHSLINLALVAAIVFAMFLVIGFGTTENVFSGFRSR